MPVVRRGLCLVLLACVTGCAEPPEPASSQPPQPAGFEQRVEAYVRAAQKYPSHVWRDVPPLNPDGTVNGYVEIPRGESTKWVFRIEANRREVDRTIPRELGGYPVNYGFLPRTISYDGDPADVLVLGPPLEGGTMVKGRIVGLMRMVDVGDLDSKLIISPLDARGRATHALDAATQKQLEVFFNTYKRHEGKVTQVTGFAGAAQGLVFLNTTAGFVRGER
jgi:inorganic pyrophosphatase